MDVNPADVQKLMIMPSIRLEVFERSVSFFIWSSSGTTIRMPEPFSSPAKSSLDCRDYTARKDMRRIRTGVRGK